jgi:hypothetical protein
MNQLRQTIERAADQQPHHDRRAVRRRQGARPRARCITSIRASGPFVVINAAAITPSAWNWNCSASSSPKANRAQDRRAGRSAWRNAVHRRNRRHAARDAEPHSARAGRSDLPAVKAARPRCRSMCASSLRPRAISKHEIAEGRFREDLFIASGRADPRAAACPTAARIFRNWSVFHGSDFGRDRLAETADRRGRDGCAAIACLAGQCPPVAQQRRASDDSRRRRRRSVDHRRHAAAGCRLDGAERCRRQWRRAH